VKLGFLSKSEGESLKEVYDYNPLLFDFVLKRTLKLPGTSKSLPASIFMTNSALGVAAISDSMEGLFCGKFARAYHGLQCKP
jgi:hypothetical protein